MNNLILKKSSQAVAWVMTVAMALAFAVPSAAAFENLGTFRYQWKAQSGTVSSNGLAHEVYANAGDTVNMSLTITNRSTNPQALVMYGKSALLDEGPSYPNAHAVGIGTSHPRDNVPAWLDSSSFAINGNRFAYYDGSPVNPGQDLTLSWTVKVAAGAADGTYDLYSEVVREWDGWAQQVTANGAPIGNGDIFWRFIIGSGSAPAQSGALTVTRSAFTPASALIADEGNANFTRFTLTAAPGTTASVSSIYVTREGLSTDTEVENVKILDATTMAQRGGTAGGFDANHRAQVFFSPSLMVTGSMDFFIRAGFSSTAAANHTARLGIAANSDIVSNASSVAGAPVFGNDMTVITITIGSLTVSEDGSVTDVTPDIGDTNVVLNTFKMTAGTTEDVTIEQITVNKAGSADASDTVNIELWDVTNNVSLGEVTGWGTDNRAVFPVTKTLGQGDTWRLRVQVDIVDGSGLTVNADIVDGSDVLVFAKGVLYGYYITPSSVAAVDWTLDATATGSNNLGQGDKNQTIAAGSLVISKSSGTVATGNIAQADDQNLGTFTFEARGEPVRVSAVHINLAIGQVAGTPDGSDVTNARLYDENGVVVAGPINGDAAAQSAGDRALDFTTVFVVPVGIHNYTLRARIGTDFAGTDTIAPSIQAAGDITATTMRTNTSISATGPAVTLNTLTVRAGALASTVLSTPVATTIVPGTSDFIWMTGEYNASASGEDILITAQQFSLVTGTSSDVDHLINMTVWADLDNNGTFETQLSNPANNSGNALAADLDKTINYDKATLTVPAGSAIKVAFKASLSASALHTGNSGAPTFVISFDGDASDVTATGASTGTAITTAPTGTGATMTVAESGTLTITLDSSRPLASLTAGLSSKVLVTVWRFTANNVEDIRIDEIKLDETDATDLEVTTQVYLGANRDHTGATVSPLSNIIAQGALTSGSASGNTFAMNPNTALRPMVPKNGYILIYAYVDTAEVDGTSVNNDETIQLNIQDVSDDVSATGLASGASIDGAGTDARNGNPFSLFKAYPTVTLSPLSPSGNLIIGELQTVAIWRITASAGDDIIFRYHTDTNKIAVQFLPFVTDLTGAEVTTRLWNYTDNVALATPTTQPTWAGTPFSSLSQVDFEFEDNDLIIPAGGYKDVAVQLDTLQWEDSADAITTTFDDGTAGDFDFGVGTSGSYTTADISFRGEPQSHTLVKA